MGINIEDDEECADCTYCRKLYVPPIDAYKDIPKDAYCCTALTELEDSLRIMYLADNNGRCEMFTASEAK